jgi:hypothetical protein
MAVGETTIKPADGPRPGGALFTELFRHAIINARLMHADAQVSEGFGRVGPSPGSKQFAYFDICL